MRKPRVHLHNHLGKPSGFDLRKETRLRTMSSLTSLQNDMMSLTATTIHRAEPERELLNSPSTNAISSRHQQS